MVSQGKIEDRKPLLILFSEDAILAIVSVIRWVSVGCEHLQLYF
jgi:hypothetical protein